MKKLALITCILFLTTANNVIASDFYPELGMDPFYSNLNPAYIDESEQGDNSTLINFFKNKFKNKKQKEVINSELESNVITEDSNYYDKENIDIENMEIDSDTEDDTDYLDYLEEEKKHKKKPKTKKELEKALMEEERAKQKDLEEELNKDTANLSFKERFLSFGKHKQKINDESQNIPNDSAIELTANYMEYFPDTYEVEAVGNAKVHFKEQNIVLCANKIIFNYDKNVLTAMENVVLLSQDSTTEGDYIKIDLTKPNGWIDNPYTKNEDITIKAKEAYLYSDKLEQHEGVAKLLRNEVIRLGATSFAGYVDQGNVFSNVNNNKNDEKGMYKIKAQTIYIESKDDHENITLKNADLYLKNRKIAVIPSMKIVTNKQRTNVETNFPEFGSESMLGSHIGPAVVLNVPGGSTLKLAPLVTYSKEKVGLGGIARFRNATNMTEMAYGTSRDRFLLRGKQKIAPGLMFNYSSYTNQSEWFLGYRMPKYSAQLNYSTNDYIKDLKLRFSQMYSAGVFVDKAYNKDFQDAEGRFRWMTQTFKPLYTYRTSEGNLTLQTALVAQTVASVYTTGDTQGLFRFGPSLTTKVGPWQQSLIYYQTATAGDSPFDFDRYRYGGSNVVFIESLKVHKYLTVGYLASVAMNREVKTDETFQENRLLLSIGPDYAKVTIGYDSIRRSTMFTFSMLVGTEDSEVEFKKTVIQNPSKFGQEKSKNKPKKKNYKKYLKGLKKA